VAKGEGRIQTKREVEKEQEKKRDRGVVWGPRNQNGIRLVSRVEKHELGIPKRSAEKCMTCGNAKVERAYPAKKKKTTREVKKKIRRGSWKPGQICHERLGPANRKPSGDPRTFNRNKINYPREAEKKRQEIRAREG